VDQREFIGDQQEALKAVVEAVLLETWTCLPGIVQSYDEATKLCVVQPSIKLTTLQVNLTPSQNNPQTRPVPITIQPIANVPLVFIGGGGMVLETTPQNGDECLLVFASRNIDGWWSKGGVQLQPVTRRHSLSDGFAIVGPRSKANLFGSLGPGIRLRTVDGSAYVELTPAGAVNILATGVLAANGGTTQKLMTDAWYQWFSTNILPFLSAQGYTGPPPPDNSETTILKAQ
jgi:hypothetical protein